MERVWRNKGNSHKGDTDVLPLDSFFPPTENASGEGGQKWQEEIALTFTLHGKCVSSFAGTEKEKDLK